jgi:hypothetical protein
VASKSKKNSPTPKPQVAELWRRGVSRLIEQGRLMWMLGEGFSAALTAQAQGWAPTKEESLATEVFRWMQQTWDTSPRGGETDPAKPQPANSSTAKKRHPPCLPGLALMQASLAEVRCPVIWVGSEQIGGQWASMAMAAGIDGLRRVLTITPGSVREQSVAEELLTDLTRRGLSISDGLLVVTEGSRTLDRALAQAWGGAIRVAHCRARLRSDILGHFPEASRSKWRLELDAAWSLPVDEAGAILRHLESRWASECPGAAERLGRSREASLVVARLNISSPLKERLESVGTLRMAFKQSLRWAPHGPGVAALAIGAPAWLQRSRRLAGWRRLELLAHKLRGLSLEPENNTAPQV